MNVNTDWDKEALEVKIGVVITSYKSAIWSLENT